MAHLVMVETRARGSLELIDHAVAMGHEVSFLAHDLSAYLRGREVRDTPLARARQVVTGIITSDPRALVESVADLGVPVDALLTLSEPHLVAVTAAAARLGLHGEDPQTAALLRDKHRVRQRLAEAGVPQPRFRLAPGVTAAVTAADEIGYPVVAKPVDGYGSIDVGIAADAGELAACARAIVQSPGYGRSVPSRRAVLVEEYVPGPVVSCEMLTAGGRHLLYGFTDRVLSDPPRAVELGGCFPAEFPERSAATQGCIAALDAVGVRRSFSHTEIALGPEGPRIIEINGRMVGGCIPEMMSLVCERNLYRDLIEFHLGRVPEPPRTEGVACIRALIAPSDGVLRVLDTSALRGRPDVAAVALDRRPGDEVRVPRSNNDRLGFLLVVAPSRERIDIDSLAGSVVIAVDAHQGVDTQTQEVGR
jgi:S-sulfo-L-cysteine synthase (3-phospho-L-serine-dependent)